MQNRLNFTKKSIESIELPPTGKIIDYYDEQFNGLLLRTTSTGTQTFYLYTRVNGTPKRVKIARYPDITIFLARKRARDLKRDISAGVDPIQERRAKQLDEITLDKVFNDYVETHDLKASTQLDYKRGIHSYLADWRDKPLKSISKDMVAKKHQELSKHSQARADNTMRVLRALFNFAQDKYEKSDGTPVILFNPCTRLTRMKLWNRVKRRRTSIKDHQLPDWYQAVNNISSRRKPVTAESARDFLLFLLFNGCRPIEASTLTWDLVDLKDRSFVFEDTKNREDHALPLSDFTHELLSRRRDNSNGSAYVFYDEDGKNIYDIRTWTKHVIDESEVPFVPYDCRRTFATAAESLDLTSYTIKRLLNHKHSEADVTSGYIQISVDRLRKPIQRISDELLIKANA